MIKEIPYIAPSQFYYWEKCPLRAVFYFEYKGANLFPVHPDSGLGAVIHKFYQNKANWGINNEKNFNEKWQYEIDKLNREYSKNKLQKRFVPVQWHASYYAVKKQLLKRTLLNNEITISGRNNGRSEIWIEDPEKVIAGMADLVVYTNEGFISKIIDFKSGKIYEKENGIKTVNKAYQLQLALYAKAVMNKYKQKTVPLLEIIDIKGKRYNINNSLEFINKTYEKARRLKDQVNNGLKKGTVGDLARSNAENCSVCYYRKVCKIYKKKFLNTAVNNIIDVKGKIKSSNSFEFDIEIDNKTYKIINKANIEVPEMGKLVTIYNLFYPSKETDSLYTVLNTVFEYEKD